MTFPSEEDDTGSLVPLGDGGPRALPSGFLPIGITGGPQSSGVAVVAVSSDTKERAAQTSEAWGLTRLRLGYGLDLASARRWGLFISTGRGITSTGVEEPARFSEPALYLIRPDRTLYFGSVQTMPFARPHFSEILAAIDFVLKNNYPARGEVREL